MYLNMVYLKALTNNEYTMASICENSLCEFCVCEPCVCELPPLPPPPTLERQTNQVDLEPDLDEHKGCEDEPCAYCLPAWRNELARLKSLPAPMSPFTAFSIRYHEKRVLSGEMRACDFPSDYERQTNDHPLNYQPLPVRTGPLPAPLRTKEERDAIKLKMNAV